MLNLLLSFFRISAEIDNGMLRDYLTNHITIYGIIKVKSFPISDKYQQVIFGIRINADEK